MNRTKLSVTVGGNNSFLKIDTALVKPLTRSKINNECLCEEGSSILIPKVLITRKKSSQVPRTSRISMQKPNLWVSNRPDTFINVRSVISKPLLTQRLAGIASEKLEGSILSKALTCRQGKLRRWTAFSNRHITSVRKNLNLLFK